MAERVAMVVLWRGPEILLEERSFSIDGNQEIRYGFFGGKVKEHENENVASAAVREVYEETGLDLSVTDLSKPTFVTDGVIEAIVYNALLAPDTKLPTDGSVLVWSRDEIVKKNENGQLMPLSSAYVKVAF